MKKTIKLTVLICIILLSFALIFTACDNNGETLPGETSDESGSETAGNETEKPEDKPPVNNTPQHQHLWSDWEIVKPATCISEGEQKCSCSCGETQTEILYMTEHIVATGPLFAVAPTCTEKGLTEGKMCAVCGEILVQQEEVAATGHNKVAISKPATCTETGLKDGEKCSLCNKIFAEPKVTAAMGHDIKTIPGKPATHEEDGLTEGKCCSRCDDPSVIVEQVVIPAGHQWEAYINAPTCQFSGESGERCTICNEWNKAESATIPYEKIDPVDCQEVENPEIPPVPPTCDTAGSTGATHCKWCKREITPATVIPAAHNYENGACTVCGEVDADGTEQKPYLLKTDGSDNVCPSEATVYYTYTAQSSVTLIIQVGTAGQYGVSYANGEGSNIPYNDGDTIELEEGETVVICVQNQDAENELKFTAQVTEN